MDFTRYAPYPPIYPKKHRIMNKMLHTILDFPYPTIALITGHTFGGACPFALAHDYRIMNANRGFFCMPPVNLGLHFDGIGLLPRLKLRPQIARKMLLEAHRWTGKEALADGVVDAIAEPERMLDLAVEMGEKWAPKAKMGYFPPLVFFLFFILCHIVPSVTLTFCVLRCFGLNEWLILLASMPCYAPSYTGMLCNSFRRLATCMAE